MPLTDVAVRNAKPGARPLKLFDARGLYLLVQPKGGKLWRLKYRFAGKEKLLSFGSYSEVSLKEARLKRDKARELLRDGLDPSLVRQATKVSQLAAAMNSYEAIARAWHIRWSTGKNAKHAAGVLSRLERDVFPSVGSMPFESVTAAHLAACALAIEARGAPEYAKRALQTAAQIGRYAVAHSIAVRNAAADIKPADVLKPMKKVNYPRLDASELPQLLHRMEAYDGSPHTRIALMLMALTFVRTGELIGARWDEFDLGAAQWRIPAERMKMKTPHIVPLSKQAIAVLRELQSLRSLSTLVFPGERNHDKPMSNNTILFALYRMGYHSRMTGHGFRGVASTVLHELGHQHELIELQLAHQERNAVSAAYNHATYLPQRAKMMQAWANHLDALKKKAPKHAKKIVNIANSS
jgi:integrase